MWPSLGDPMIYLLSAVDTHGNNAHGVQSPSCLYLWKKLIVRKRKPVSNNYPPGGWWGHMTDCIPPGWQKLHVCRLHVCVRVGERASLANEQVKDLCRQQCRSRCQISCRGEANSQPILHTKKTKKNSQLIVWPHSAANNIESCDTIKEPNLQGKVIILSERLLLPATLQLKDTVYVMDHEQIQPLKQKNEIKLKFDARPHLSLHLAAHNWSQVWCFFKGGCMRRLM